VLLEAQSSPAAPVSASIPSKKPLKIKPKVKIVPKATAKPAESAPDEGKIRKMTEKLGLNFTPEIMDMGSTEQISEALI
jgi:hypothetical protein